jgi:hypothetical protein
MGVLLRQDAARGKGLRPAGERLAMAAWLAEWIRVAFVLAGAIGMFACLLQPNSPRRSHTLGAVILGMILGQLACRLFINANDTFAKWELLLFSAMTLLIGLGHVRKLSRERAE